MAELYLHSHAELLNNQDSTRPPAHFVCAVLQDTAARSQWPGYTDVPPEGRRVWALGSGWVGFWPWPEPAYKGHRCQAAKFNYLPLALDSFWFWSCPLGSSSSRCPGLWPAIPLRHAIIPSGCLFVCLFVVSSVASLHFALVKHFKSHKSRPQQKQKDPLSPRAGHPIHYTISAGLAFASVIEIKLLPN